MKNKDKSKKRIAIVGIQGVPSKYGGFETLVEHLIEDDSVELPSSAPEPTKSNL